MLGGVFFESVVFGWGFGYATKTYNELFAQTYGTYTGETIAGEKYREPEKAWY